MNIGGFQKFSLVDYPEKLSCIVFTQGCNFRCGYCHNPELVDFSTGSLMSENIIEFLQTRQNKLDAVVITGGEPTLQKNLLNFITEIKNLGFFVKLDTNGTNPLILEELLAKNLLNYVAMDIKAPFDKYKTITNSDVDVNCIQKSLEIIKNAKIEHEFRTTVVKEQLSIEDIFKIADETKGSRHYFQKFVFSKHVDEEFKHKSTYSNEEFEKINSMLNRQGFNCYVR
jgi:pyruvate formate lyase activating enzyme